MFTRFSVRSLCDISYVYRLRRNGLGGFLAGLIIPHDNGLAIAMVEKFEDLLSILFLPLVRHTTVCSLNEALTYPHSTLPFLDCEPILDFSTMASPGVTYSSFALLRSFPNSWDAQSQLIPPVSTGANQGQLVL